MTNTCFTTPEAAQEAFYDAIERADLEKMMAIWSEDEDIVCIHPGGGQHSGRTEIRESWRLIFLHDPQLRFRLVAGKSVQEGMLSIHSVREQISHSTGAHPPASAIATNVFVLSDDGWKMLIHHASPIPAARLQEQSPPSVLH
jgi:ketosteroid isomerase-like protein